jgi:hypothetical protein
MRSYQRPVHPLLLKGLGAAMLSAGVRPPPEVDPREETKRGCRTAGCRTLSGCICNCRRCRIECHPKEK